MSEHSKIEWTTHTWNPWIGCTKVSPGWIIVGGESGSEARPCNVEWVRQMVLQCRAAGVACFVKQLGSQPRGWCRHWLNLEGHDPDDKPAEYCDAYEASDTSSPCGRCLFLQHPKGGDPSEWPEDLRVREFAEVVR